jgi:ABC-type branched-subunit amino acid transport system ATPase component
MPLLETHGLVWQHDPQQGVREIDLTLDPGEVVSVLASNRARLLTLLQLLQGQWRPEAGSIHFDGADVTSWKPERRRARGLVSALSARPARLFESLGWRRELTVEEEVVRIRGHLDRPAANPEQLLTDFALLDYRRVPVGRLPADTQPLFDLLCCILWRPRILLVNNPFLTLAADRTAFFHAVLRRLRDSGIGLLIVDGSVEQTAPVTNRFVVLAKGRPVGQGSLEELARSPRIREASFWKQIAAKCGLDPSPPSRPSTVDDGATEQPPAPRRLGSGDSAFSSLAVIVRYPTPLAIAYRRFCRQQDPATRLQMLNATVEIMLRYLVTLGLADLFACSDLSATEDIQALRSDAFEFLRYPKPMLLGLWVRALRELAAALGEQRSPFFPDFPAACGPKSPLVNEALQRLVTLRNQLAHPTGGIPLTPDQIQDMLREARPLLERALQQIQFVGNYPLGFTQPGRVPPRAGGHRYHLHACMGAGVANTGEAYALETPLPLPTQIPFVVAPDGRALLCLWPWLVQRVSTLSGRHALYLFEDIPDRRKPFLGEMRWVALDGREDWREVLHDGPARDHTWLRRRLHELPSRQPLPVDLRLHDKLLQFREGQLVGRRVGRYHLLSVVAVGGFSTIYAAEHPETGERVAVKLLESPEALRHLARFQREFAMLREAGQHPHVVRCLEAGCDIVNGRDYPWYAMEFAGGGDLADRIAERVPTGGALPWDDRGVRGQILQEFQAIAGAVAHLHRLGILHRDVKPANVLILDDGTLRLSDFGLVKSLDPGADAGHTSTGAVLGTRDYMAGEQARGEDVDARADVYSLAILLAELATGRRPHPDTFAAQGSTLRTFAPLNQLPDALRGFLLRCTDVAPERRPKDGQAVVDLFTQLLSRLEADGV